MNISRFISVGVRSVVVKNVQRNGCYNSNILNLTYNSCLYHQQVKLVSTYEIKNVEKQDSLVKKILKKIPFVNVDKMKLKARGYILYEEIADKIDYFEIFEEYNLPDTFNSWFTVTELYIWMLSLRCMVEGDSGKILRNAIIEALWTDVAQRVKKLEAGSLRPQIVELSEQMQAAFIAYDEGIQSDDTVLAGAVWRRLYNMEHVDPVDLEKVVKYIRKQVAILDTLPTDALIIGKSKTIEWLPVSSG